MFHVIVNFNSAQGFVNPSQGQKSPDSRISEPEPAKEKFFYLTGNDQYLIDSNVNGTQKTVSFPENEVNIFDAKQARILRN